MRDRPHPVPLRDTVLSILCWSIVTAWTLVPASVSAEGLWVHPDSRFASVDQALAADDFPRTQKLISELRAQSRKSNDLAFQAELMERSKEISKMAREYEKVSKALKSQQDNKLPPKSALEAGKYFCIVKADWGKGLPLLMEGPDAQLAAVANADKMNLDQPEQQLEVAEKWLDLAQKTKNSDERSAYQLRGRHWLLLAGNATKDEQALTTIRTQLKQIPLYPERIVVWNTHNDVTGGRGAEEFVVSLLNDGKVVWKQAVPIAYKPKDPSFVLVRPPRTRADQIRIDITKHHAMSGGLGEIQVFIGSVNISDHLQPAVDSFFESDDRFGPSTLVDGDVSGASGFWVAETGKGGSASIHFQQFSLAK